MNDQVSSGSPHVIKTAKQHDLIFSALNAHCSEAGPPPGIIRRADDRAYHGYFENEYGEQWVLTIDRKAKEGVLRGGDAGWDNNFQIRDGTIDSDILFGREEWSWLCLCWITATGDPMEPTPWVEARREKALKERG